MKKPATIQSLRAEVKKLQGFLEAVEQENRDLRQEIVHLQDRNNINGRAMVLAAKDNDFLRDTIRALTHVDSPQKRDVTYRTDLDRPVVQSALTGRFPKG